MTVIVLSACPVGLRGDLTRWLLEIAPGVFVGRVSARVRERVWTRVKAFAKSGRAIMVYPAANEQHLAFEVHQPDWVPVDCDGLELIMRPKGTEDATFAGPPKKNWSKASRFHKARKFSS